MDIDEEKGPSPSFPESDLIENYLDTHNKSLPERGKCSQFCIETGDCVCPELQSGSNVPKRSPRWDRGCHLPSL